MIRGWSFHVSCEKKNEDSEVSEMLDKMESEVIFTESSNARTQWYSVKFIRHQFKTDKKVLLYTELPAP